MKKEEIKNNNNIDATEGEEVDEEITAVYAKDAESEDGNEEESENDEDADEEVDEDAKVTAKDLLAKLSSAVDEEGKDSINSCYPKKGINGKNLLDIYSNVIMGIIATILDMLEKFVKGGGTFDKKQAACFKKNLLYIVKMSQNITLAIISGFRFQSNLNIFQIGWNWICSKVAWGWMNMVDEFTIFKKSTGAYNSETVNNKLDKLNNIIYDIVRIFNNAYPEYAIKITKQYEVEEKFNPKKFNNFLWFFDSNADAKSQIVAFDREFYTDYAKKIDNYCFWKGIQTGSLIFGCIVVAGVGYCIYSFGWDGFINKISEILNTKSESTAEEKDELFNTEEVEYLY